MRIFLTGATGHVGSAVLQALVRGGHEVSTLHRNPRESAHASMPDTRSVVGDLSEPETYTAVAETCDAVVHTAFDSKRGPQVDRQAIDALLAVCARRANRGQRATFVYTSSAWVLGNTSGQATEDAPVRATPHVEWRPEHERLVLEAGRRPLLRTVVVRPGIVYGGSRGVIADLLKTAANGLVRVIGDGRNHWACVHDKDLADLFVRVATNPDASGVYHATDEADERVADIVESVARHAKSLPDIRNVPIGEARAKMGPYADALALNQIVRSPRARALGWSPTSHSVAGSVARLLEEFRAKSEAA